MTRTEPQPSDRKPAPSRTGGAEGNERLTAMTGAVLLVLLAVEGLTILRLHALLTIHFFIGMLLLGPVLLKMCSTSYRFIRYYTGAAAYTRKGPPAVVLRLLGPMIMLTSIGVLGTGVALAIIGPGPGLWLLAHKAFFILWFAAMAIHVLWYAPRLPSLLRSGSPERGQAHAMLAGAGRRWVLLLTALIAGLITAIATYHLAHNWQGAQATLATRISEDSNGSVIPVTFQC